MTGEDSRQYRARPNSRREQVIELGVFLFLIVPSMIFSFFVVKGGRVDFPLAALSNILGDLGLVSLVLFFLWRNNEPLRLIGWTRKDWQNDARMGAFLFVPFFFGVAGVEHFFRSLGFSAPHAPLPSFLQARGWVDLVLATVMVVVVAISEETIFRGYLLLRLKAAFGGNRGAAVFWSAVIFSLGHGYEGSSGVLTVLVIGLVFALIYEWRKSLVTTMVMHFLLDFTGIVVAPLLTGHG